MSIEDEVRSAYVDQLKILAVDDPFAVARSKTQVLEFERSRDGKWRIRLLLPLAEDWISESSRGFSTHVDEEKLRRAYLAYLSVTEGKYFAESPISDKSPTTIRGIRRRWNIVGEALAVAGTPPTIGGKSGGERMFDVHCLGTDGRYAFFVVTGISAGQPFGDECFNVEGYPRLAVFRADNGRDWKVYDEGVVPNRGLHTDE